MMSEYQRKYEDLRLLHESLDRTTSEKSKEKWRRLDNNIAVQEYAQSQLVSYGISKGITKGLLKERWFRDDVMRQTNGTNYRKVIGNISIDFHENVLAPNNNGWSKDGKIKCGINYITQQIDYRFVQNERQRKEHLKEYMNDRDTKNAQGAKYMLFSLYYSYQNGFTIPQEYLEFCEKLIEEQRSKEQNSIIGSIK